MTNVNLTVRFRDPAPLIRGVIRDHTMKMHRLLADLGSIAPRLSVGVDIDDVLYPWYDTAHGICEAAGITNGITPTTWAPHEEYGCEKQAWIDALDGPTLSGGLYTADPFPDVVEQLWRLREHGHYVHLITARGAWVHSEAVQEFTRQWVADHGIPHDSLTFAQKKAEAVACDFFIDDHVRNYDELDAAGVPVLLLDRPWNGGGRTNGWPKDGRRRVSSLEEFVNIVLEAE